MELDFTSLGITGIIVLFALGILTGRKLRGYVGVYRILSFSIETER